MAYCKRTMILKNRGGACGGIVRVENLREGLLVSVKLQDRVKNARFGIMIRSFCKIWEMEGTDATFSLDGSLRAEDDVLCLLKGDGVRYSASAFSTGEEGFLVLEEKMDAFGRAKSVSVAETVKNELPLQAEEKAPLQEFDQAEESEQICDDAVASENYFEKVVDVLNATDPQEVIRALSEEQGKSPSFYESVRPQLDDLFSRFERVSTLESVVPDSRWVRVAYDEGDASYVVGVLNYDGVPAYVCYGVPAAYASEPHPELEGYSQWLPEDPSDPYGAGYFVMFQSAETGETVTE